MTATAAPPKSPAPAIADELRRIPLAELHESPLNPRTSYDPQALEELRDSLLSSGQLTPLIVRPRKGGGYEIAAGHRRYRAAKLARERSAQGAAYRGLDQLVAVVRELDERTFIEVLNIENLQRDDLHPLEEAAGFRQLMEKAGYDVAKIASRIGRSTKYVYDRIKLLQLVPEAKQMFLAGEFEAGHAIILARLSAEDQRRAIDKDAEGRWGRPAGLFEAEQWDAPPDLPAQQQIQLEDTVKPVSVRELQTWVDDNVRFKLERDADPMLFPQTAQLLAAAREEELKVVHITHDYRVPDAARDEKQRTYGEQAWKRADGKHKSKECDYAVLGVVVAGPGRGDAFRVCVRKDKCKVHWATEQKEAARRAKDRAKYGIERTDDRDERAFKRQQAEEARRDQENARWKKALPALREALAAKIRTAPAGSASELGRIVLEACTNSWGLPGPAVKDLVPIGRTAEELVRRAAWLNILGDLNDYRAEWTAPTFKALGLNAQKIVDEVAPKPAAKKKPAKRKTAR